MIKESEILPEPKTDAQNLAEEVASLEDYISQQGCEANVLTALGKPGTRMLGRCFGLACLVLEEEQ